MVKMIFTRNRSNRFSQTISSQHIDTHRKDKFLYCRRNSRTCCREESTSIQTKSLLQQVTDRFFIELILHVQPHWWSLTLAYIVHIVFTTYLDSILHQCLLHTCSTSYHFIYAGIHLFPESRNATHYCRTHFLDGHLDVLRAKVDIHFSTYAQAPTTKSTFKDMGKRQEVDDYIIFIEIRKTFHMGIHHRFITGMIQHYPLAFSGSTTRIEDIHQILLLRFGRTLVHFCLMLTLLALRQEFIKIDGRFIPCIQLHFTIEYHNLLQGRA